MRHFAKGDARLVPAFILYALLASLLLALDMPPYGNADEVNHFLRADQISRLGLVGERFAEGRNSGGLVAPGIEASALPFEPLKFHPERKATTAMYVEAGRAHWREPPVWTGFANTSIYPPFLYAPSVVAIWAGKGARLSVIHTLYLARLLTGLASCLLIGAALLVCWRCGQTGAALLIFVLATLPMSLALQNACSQDGLMLGLAALAAALFARERSGAGTGRLGGVAFCLALIAMARPPYLPLALAPLAVPAPWRARLGAGAVIAACCLAWTALAASFAAIDTTAGHGANVRAQLTGLLDPARDFELVVNTFRVHGGIYLRGFVAGLGWLDVDVPPALLAASYAALALAALAALRRPGRAGALLAFLALASAGLIFLVQYLTWTAVGDPAVDGVQGRYFLPVALLLAGLGTTMRGGAFDRAAVGLALLYPVLSIGLAMRAIVIRYYLT